MLRDLIGAALGAREDNGARNIGVVHQLDQHVALGAAVDEDDGAALDREVELRLANERLRVVRRPAAAHGARRSSRVADRQSAPPAGYSALFLCDAS